MISSDIVIIGGGAAGLMAAARLGDSGYSVTLIEKKSTCGRKLLITGKGRCNMTNMKEWDEFSTHIHPNPSFLKYAFYNFSNKDLLAFFNKAGLTTKVERGDRAFPESDRSQDVLDTLIKYLNRKKVNILNDLHVMNVSKLPDLSFRIDVRRDIYSDNKRVNNYLSCDVICAQAVILATGGLSYPLTGSTGDGYGIAEGFGHTIIPTHPSLTALSLGKGFAQLIGLELKNVRLDLYINGGLAQSETGDLNFTDGGLEGPLGFRVSRKAVKAFDDGQKVELLIDMKPALTIEQLRARINREKSDVSTASGMLHLLLPFKLVPFFISQNPGMKLDDIPNKIKNWKISVCGHVGYERCVITAGGVSLNEISRKTMESKSVPGLFFAGEIMDLDGDTGGYNLQIAFSTAALAAKYAKQRLDEKNVSSASKE